MTVRNINCSKEQSLSQFKGMPSLASLTSSLTARLPLRVGLWFKRPDSMDPRPWDLLLDRLLNQPTANTLQLYNSAAKEAADPESLLGRLDVSWIWHLKHLEWAPFHEVSVIQTVDTLQGNEIRRFVLHRTYLADGGADRIEVNEVQPTTTLKD